MIKKSILLTVWWSIKGGWYSAQVQLQTVLFEYLWTLYNFLYNYLTFSKIIAPYEYLNFYLGHGNLLFFFVCFFIVSLFSSHVAIFSFIYLAIFLWSSFFKFASWYFVGLEKQHFSPVYVYIYCGMLIKHLESWICLTVDRPVECRFIRSSFVSLSTLVRINKSSRLFKPRHFLQTKLVKIRLWSFLFFN